MMLGIVAVVAALAYVAWPLFADAGPETIGVAPEVGETSPEHWEHLRQEALDAIKEAEFDRAMGKLADSDFAWIREKYARQALDAMSHLEGGKTEQPSRPASSPRPASDRSASVPPTEAAPNAGPSRRFAFCPECGAALPQTARFCPGCAWKVGSLAA